MAHEIPEIVRDERRINGFAENDRVAVIDGELTGALGKVEFSGTGCHPDECRHHCRLVHVALTHEPSDTPPFMAPLYRRSHSFRVSQITHID